MRTKDAREGALRRGPLGRLPRRRGGLALHEGEVQVVVAGRPPSGTSGGTGGGGTGGGWRDVLWVVWFESWGERSGEGEE